MDKILCIVAMGVFAFVPNILFADIPDQILHLAAEMKETGSTCQGGYLDEYGLFFIGVGSAQYKESDLSYSREIAEINAKKQLSAMLRESFRAKDTVGLTMTADGAGSSEMKAFVSSHAESEIDQLMRGWQVLSVGRNEAGRMEVVGFISARMVDMTDQFAKAQLEWGDKGVVSSVGVDMDRSIAIKNALRGAVEQVAGTMIVGKVSINEKEELHKRLATTATALVEEYRVLRETKIDAEYRVEVLARVSKKKLYDSYRSYFKSLDDPSFCLVATDPALIRNFQQFFVDKGFRLTNNPNDAQYLIKLGGHFRDRPTPGNLKSEGTMLDLRISVDAVDGSRTLLTMNEKQSKDSEILTAEQRREEVSRRIFKKLEKHLHRAIQDMVVRMLDDSDQTSVIKHDGSTINF